jgi:hypothetical protein
VTGVGARPHGDFNGRVHADRHVQQGLKDTSDGQDALTRRVSVCLSHSTLPCVTVSRRRTCRLQHASPACRLENTIRMPPLAHTHDVTTYTVRSSRSK